MAPGMNKGSFYLGIPEETFYSKEEIRERSTLKNKLVKMCKGRLLGHKGTQFDWWLKKFPYLNSLIYRKEI